MKQTEHYSLDQPAKTDYADVSILNGNMDKLDAALATLEHSKAETVHAHTMDDVADLETALSNKANVADHRLKTFTTLAQLGLSGAVTMEQVVEAMPASASAFIASNSTTANYIANTPKTSRYWHVIIDKNSSNYVACHAMRVDGGEMMYVGRYHLTTTPKFQGWIPLATATPPQELDLPLAAGVMGNAIIKFAKTQENILHLYGSVAVQVSAGEYKAIGTLPAGYRPAGSLQLPAATNAGAAAMRVFSDGRIDLFSSVACGYVYIDVAFVASS